MESAQTERAPQNLSSGFRVNMYHAMKSFLRRPSTPVLIGRIFGSIPGLQGAGSRSSSGHAEPRGALPRLPLLTDDPCGLDGLDGAGHDLPNQPRDGMGRAELGKR